MTESKTKLEFFGLISADPEIDLKGLVQKLKVPITTLRKWKKEYYKQEDIKDIDKVLNVDEIIVKQIAEQTVDKVVKVLPSEVKKSGEEVEEFKKKKVEEFTQKVDGLDLLKTELQDKANTLILSIGDALKDSHMLDAKDLQSLASALTSVQNAFFNKNTTEVKVNQFQGLATLEAFRERQKA